MTRVFADDKAIRSASSDLVRELHESIRRLPQLPMAARWVAGSGEGQVHRAAVLDGSSVIMNFGSFEGLRSWRAFEDAWRSDSVLRDSEKQTAGFWNPQTVLHWALPKSIALRRSKAVLDEAGAVSSILGFRQKLCADNVEMTARARVLGLRLACRAIKITENTSLARLTRSEANARQPIEFLSMFTSPTPMLALHRAEIRARVRVPLKKPMSFVEGSNQGQEAVIAEARRCFEAVQLATTGQIELGPIEVGGGTVDVSVGSRGERFGMGSRNVSVGARDAADLRAAYDLVSGDAPGDNVLPRAARRFVIGRQRRDDVDRVVDYVVAAEALFLTINGGTSEQELRYRFAVNGTLLLRAAGVIQDRAEAHRRLREAYDCRSGIVHGGSKRDVSNAREVAAFLEGSLRSAFFWLYRQPPADRPYLRAGGWEELLWA